MHLALNLSDNQMALLQGPALALPFVVLSIPLGICIDRFSRARLMLIVTSIEIAGSLLTAAASGFVEICIARCLVGLAAFAINPIVLSSVADLYAPAQRGRAAMAISIGQFGGMSAAFAFGGALITAIGPGESGWRSAMIWLTSPLLAALGLMLAAREPLRNKVITLNPGSRAVIRQLWQYKGIIGPLLTGIIMLEISLGAMLVWSAPTLIRAFGMAAEGAGTIVATGLAVSGLFGPIVGGVLADMCQRTGGPRRTMAALTAVALFSVPMGLFAIAPSIAFVGVLFVILTTSISAMIVMGSTLFMVIVPGELRGLCMGLLAGVCVFFGIAVAPLTTSMLSIVLGGAGMIGSALTAVCAGTMLICAASFAMGRHHYA
jgi:MFS family permease